jgi:hypothetical protein
VEISVPLPLDNDGFLRRQCPHCNSQFKWHHGPANEEAEQATSPSAYHCPLCGQPAETDRWNTDEQNEYVEGVATPAVIRHADDLIKDAFKGLNSKYFKVKMTGHLDTPAEPDALVEPDDMVIVVSPCHAYEPVKVPDDAAGPFRCLVCGQPFAV